MRLLSAWAAAFALTRVVRGLTSGLTAVTDFVSTSDQVAMYVYIPTTKTESPAVVVAIHSCGRDAEYYYENTGYAALADQHGYIVIYPNSSAIDGCWDVTSKATITHNGGGDSQAIVNMVDYVTSNYNANASRVAITGSSSGGVMVSLLAGVYPNVFQAGSIFSGYYSDTIYPYDGVRTKMMIWHGTADDKYPYSWFIEELSGWSNVLDVTFTQNITDTPVPGYTKMVYGDGHQLIGISAAGVGHTVPVDAVTDLSWFCIDPECDENGNPIDPATMTTSSSSTSSSPTTSPSATSTNSDASATTTDSSPTSQETAATSTSSNTAASETSSTATPVPIAAKSTLSSGAKVGIAVSSLAGVAILLTLALFFLRKRRQVKKSELEPLHTFMPSESETGHEMQAGYGVVPKHEHDNAPSSDNEILKPGPMTMEPTAGTGLLAYVPYDHYRDSTTSTLLQPYAGGNEMRYSTASDAMLLPPPSRSGYGDRDRDSVASTLSPPHFNSDENRFSAASSAMLLPPRHSSLSLAGEGRGEREGSGDAGVHEQDIGESAIEDGNENGNEIVRRPVPPPQSEKPGSRSGGS